MRGLGVRTWKQLPGAVGEGLQLLQLLLVLRDRGEILRCQRNAAQRHERAGRFVAGAPAQRQLGLRAGSARMQGLELDPPAPLSR